MILMKQSFELFLELQLFKGFTGDSDSKESACNAGGPGSILGSGRSPWRREWLPTPVFLLGEFHGQRSPRATVHGVTKSQTWWARTASRGQKLALGNMSAPTQPHPSCLALLLNPPCHPGSMNSPAFSMPETDLPVPEFPIIQFQPLEILFPYPVSLIAIF